VVYAQLKFMWATGAREESLSFLRQFSASLARDVMQETNAQTVRPGVSKSKMAELSKLVARCYYKQGEWQVSLKDDWSSVRLSLSIDFSLNKPFFRGMSRTFCTLIT
jgi:FKBP12-rapamycin complex-associated protein